MSAFKPYKKPDSAPTSQFTAAREQLASQGLTSTNPTSREKGLAALGVRPKSPSLGFGRKRRKTRKGGRKHRKSTKKSRRS